jgi:hypothetical protein
MFQLGAWYYVDEVRLRDRGRYLVRFEFEAEFEVDVEAEFDAEDSSME